MIARLLATVLVVAPLTAGIAATGIAATGIAEVQGQNRPDSMKVRDTTLKAVKLLSDVGVEAARPRFYADPEFRYGEVYVNVIDLNGAWVIYPPAPKNEGKSVLNVTDSDGKFLVKDIIALAQDQGEGWVEYRWLNPASNRIEPKLTFVKRVPGMDLIVYAGLYRP